MGQDGAPPMATVADLNFRIQIQHLAEKASGRGDASLAAILAAAVRTLDQRIAAAERCTSGAAAAPPAASLVKKTVEILGRKSTIIIEEDFWALFEDIANDRESNTDDLLSFVAKTHDPKLISSEIRIFVLRDLVERVRAFPDTQSNRRKEWASR